MPPTNGRDLPNDKELTPHGSLPERTYHQLRDLIVRGRILPEQRVVEAEVSERFGVSRTPVREALARLVQEGYLVPITGQRRTEVAVAPLSTDSVAELWGMIGALEGYAVSTISAFPAARREILADDLEKLNQDLHAASAAKPRNADKLFELQAAFHQRFIDETAGSHLLTVYAMLRPQVQRYEWVYGTRLDADYEPSTTEHLHIIAAVRSGDAKTARQAVESHWARAAARTIAIIEEINAHPGPRRRSRLAPGPRKRMR
jgi:Transcriptional regulators